MLLRMPLVVSSGREKTYTVDLPSFAAIEWDFVALTALVEVPDADLPQHQWARDDLARDATRPGGRRRWPHKDTLDAWHAHIDERYQEHAGRFRPIPV